MGAKPRAPVPVAGVRVTCMGNSIGWLETRLARIIVNCIKIAQVCLLFEVILTLWVVVVVVYKIVLPKARASAWRMHDRPQLGNLYMGVKQMGAIEICMFASRLPYRMFA